MMPAKKVALPLVILVAALLGGCAAPRPAELKFRCVLPKAAVVVAESELASAFANRLAAACRLDVLSQTRQTGRTSADITYIVGLRSAVVSSVYVNVLFNVPSRTVAVTISGEIRHPEASRIVREASRVFSVVFPGSALAPYSGDQALFGR